MLLEQKLNEDILKITMKIRNEHPELLKYLNELTVTLPDVNNPEMTNKVLQEYFNSLESILKKYTINQ
ncbi:hypothetical protein [Flavobacterium sp. N1994]|uniref:hypothetical protein n=1 Tax=Flavobacterium sp. N1994 TaxID=2986827 RepID=UPI0022230278|nr:hypothetical protein [Flavobacterium sp. N1994]